ncbi:pilin [Pseudidiomarina homiensis]|uniref:pilin n=1 Tax=Pseudidiomarina homiensis TaxID=364198 RepID=UPI00215B1E57|nr:prepilin-type N-terminal cleavage/methylation domain-containing protein [Pseudidiomarina homiensis]
MKAQVQKGFTLIELMIVVAIIGILAAVAIPLYSDYTQRAKASTGITALASLKTAVSMCYQENGTVTGCSSTSSTTATKIPAALTDANAINGLNSASVTDGTITAQLDAVDTSGTNITVNLVPADGGGSTINWVLQCSDYGTDGTDSRVDGCVAATGATVANKLT